MESQTGDNQGDKRRSPWSAEDRQQATNDLLAGTFKAQPITRYPVILTMGGPISSAQELQQLAELESLPETTQTNQVDWNRTAIGEVTICHVSYKEMKKIEEKADISFSDLVLFNGNQRYAMVVRGLKDVTPVEQDANSKGGEAKE